MFRKLPFVLLGVILLAAFLEPWIPLFYSSLFYAVSLSLKELILIVLPFVIFGLLFKAAAELSKQATRLIIVLLLGIVLSNFLSTLLSGGIGKLTYQLDLNLTLPEDSLALKPLWEYPFPKWIGNAKAMFAGLILGILLGWWKPHRTEKIVIKVEKVVHLILKAILLIIPLFIFGFVLKLRHDKVMSLILKNYSIVFLLIGSSLILYIGFLYLLANRFNFPNTFKSIKNMLPAAFSAFGSMSSAASMPLTILGTEKNVRGDFARAIIPATVNVHLIGDCFSIPILAFAILKGFGFQSPDFFTYLSFATSFVIAKFSVAAVPGGGILVMLPILENTLGFNGDMLSLITALYILFDPVVTTANVMGNGAFAMLMSLITRRKIGGLDKNGS